MQPSRHCYVPKYANISITRLTHGRGEQNIGAKELNDNFYPGSVWYVIGLLSTDLVLLTLHVYVMCRLVIGRSQRDG